MVAGHSLEYVTHDMNADAERAECECGWLSDWCTTQTAAVAQWHDHSFEMEPVEAKQ